eukprot:TRINITY_DN424_c0_g6_i2.p1 TRINITY_DN424_c0_g6~~TRINITY_DN424_c0_g6_i2.p1  ORF type:complete len:274 (+),score=91.84 TRINITY_DN424_c0_g6_i2:45-824(+)
MLRSLVGSEMCIRDRYQRRVRGTSVSAMDKIKVVIVGDGGIGKTCLVNALEDPTAEMDTEYKPTVAETHVINWEYQGKDRTFDLWDTAGQEPFAQLRKLAYANTQVAIVGFNMTAPTSLNNVVGEKSWLAEIRSSIPDFSSFIMIGTQKDRWEELPEGGEKITNEQIWEVAESLGCKALILTSAFTKDGVMELRDAIARVGVADQNSEAVPNWERPKPEPVPDPPVSNPDDKPKDKDDTKRDANQSDDKGKDTACCTMM